MSNLPDNYDHAAFGRRHERDLLEISDETHAVAAIFYLCEYLQIPSDDAALHDFTWEAVYENETSESEENDAYNEVSSELKKQYENQPNECLRVLGLIVKDKEKSRGQ